MTQKFIAEFVGTLTLVFVTAGVIIATQPIIGTKDDLIVVALACGLAIGTMVSALGHVSGAHFNPAVTIGAWVTQKIDMNGALTYIAAQLTGAITGAALIRVVLPSSVWQSVNLGTPGLNPALDSGQAIVFEAILTFFLVWVIFATAIDPEGAFGKIAGLSIGFVVTMGIAVGSPFTGAAMNPARAFGPALVGGYWANWGVYWIGPIGGGILAAVLYDSVILRNRGAGGSAAPGEAPHGWGAHGEDADATPDAHEH